MLRGARCGACTWSGLAVRGRVRVGVGTASFIRARVRARARARARVREGSARWWHRCSRQSRAVARRVASEIASGSCSAWEIWGRYEGEIGRCRVASEIASGSCSA